MQIVLAGSPFDGVVLPLLKEHERFDTSKILCAVLATQ